MYPHSRWVPPRQSLESARAAQSPSVFEVYAADDALGFSIETLPFVDADSTGELSAEIVLSTWVSSLSLSLLAHLTGTILPQIRNLSTSGAAQLGSDLGYLSNAVKALDVEWEDLEKWRETDRQVSEA